ncbi:MAG: hypothetical protein V7727_00445 [Sneathiella sp.]
MFKWGGLLTWMLLGTYDLAPSNSHRVVMDDTGSNGCSVVRLSGMLGIIDDLDKLPNEKAGSEDKPTICDVDPDDLCEQMILMAAKAGAGEIKMRNLVDEPRLVAHYGPGRWVKKE